MIRPLQTAMLLSLVLIAPLLSASTLSVVPLSDSLKNSALEDPKSDEFEPAFEAINAQMLNQPATETELAGFRTRVSNLAKYRYTRVGKLFFAALSGTPSIENLAEGAEFAAINTTWPLALGTLIRVRVEWTRLDDAWKISALEVTLDGVAGAPISGMAPYFGSGELRPALLDFGPIDYLVGRDPADRERPESERPAFDYSAAVEALFESETGAFESVVKALQKSVSSGVEPKDRLAALTPHLATEAEIKAATAASDDPERRSAFWNGIYDQLKNALKTPRPGSVPEGKGAEVRIRFRMADDGGTLEGHVAALRLQSGKVAPRGEQNHRKDTPNGEESNGSGN